MGRDRLVRTNFFVDDDLCACSPLARLFFVGLWTEADREGRLEDRPGRLKRRLLPDDRCTGEGLLSELADHHLIVRYSANGGDYIWIPGFARNQKVHPREAASVIPPPESAVSEAGGKAKGEPRQTAGKPRSAVGVKSLPASTSTSTPTSTSEEDADLQSAKGAEPPSTDETTCHCALVDMPAETRKDTELWAALDAVLGRSAGALLGTNRHKGNAGAIHRFLIDLCGFCDLAMGTLTCEQRFPVCRVIAMEALGRLATAEDPIKLAVHIRENATDLADFCGEDLLERARQADKAAPLPQMLDRLTDALRDPPMSEWDRARFGGDDD